MSEGRVLFLLLSGYGFFLWRGYIPGLAGVGVMHGWVLRWATVAWLFARRWDGMTGGGRDVCLERA